MTDKIEKIEINLGSVKTPDELAQGLRVIAGDIEQGYQSGIAGWSDMSWSISWINETAINKMATNDDLNKVCIFWNDSRDEIIDVLYSISEEFGYLTRNSGTFYKRCRRLTEDEIEKYV